MDEKERKRRQLNYQTRTAPLIFMVTFFVIVAIVLIARTIAYSLGFNV